MIIVFEDREEVTLTLTVEDDELFITVGGENNVDGRDNTFYVEDVDRFIESIKFLMGHKSV